jgi:hypothetical protein
MVWDSGFRVQGSGFRAPSVEDIVALLSRATFITVFGVQSSGL